MITSRYQGAIQRCLAELQRALLNRTTLLGLEDANGVSHPFLLLTYYAFFNDYIAHCIKIFEEKTRAASFWHIYRTHQKSIDEYARRKKIRIQHFKEMSNKLKTIRNKTHFHIDKNCVLNSQKVWRDAGLSGKDLATAVNAAWDILKYLQKSLDLPEISLPQYSREFVHRVALAIEEGKF